MKFFVRLLVLLVGGFFGALPAASAPLQKSGPRYRISLLTISPGAELEERLGHSAIAVEDLVSGSALAYNFGTFGDDEEVVYKFLHKRLAFWVAAYNPGQIAVRYREREIRTQELGLDDAQAARLAEFLAERAKPQNRAFDYDLFTSNCVTPIRDVLNYALSGALFRHTSGPSPQSYRQAIMHGLETMPLIGAFSALIYGPYTDQPRSRWEMLFMPDALHDAMAELRQGDGPDAPALVVREKTWRGDAYSPLLPLPNPRYLAAALGMLLLGGFLLRHFARTRTIGQQLAFSGAALIALFGGACGLLVFYLGFTPHAGAAHNANRFLLNPLDLLAVPLFFVAASGRLERRGARVLVFLLGGTTLLAAVHLVFGHLLGMCRQEHWPVMAWVCGGRGVLLLSAFILQKELSAKVG